MNFESKLSNSTSALSECRSEDPDDQFLNPVKNLIPSPFVLSSSSVSKKCAVSETKILLNRMRSNSILELTNKLN
jgi:hypothetical protein